MNVLINGQLVDYLDQGKGPVVLLLHGWGTTSKSLEIIAAALAKNHRVIRLDFPGFGGSPQPKTDWWIGDYATFVGEFVKKLELAVDTAIGHSFGGRVIIKSIATKTLEPAKVVLIGAAGVKAAPTLKKQAFKTVAKTGKAITALPGLRALRNSLRKRLYDAAGNSDYLNAGTMRTIFLKTINEDLLPLVHSITQPVLMIWGEDDQETPVADAKKMKAELANATLLVVPNAGHYVFMDQPAIVLQALEQFV